MSDLVPALLGAPRFLIGPADRPAEYHRLRERVFVTEQGLFTGTDRDERDDDPRTVVLDSTSAMNQAIAAAGAGGT
ncbi:AIR synthase, partial [Dactylosporangium sp. NPDC005572]